MVFFADMRNKSRAKYHYAIRYIHKNNESIKANRMANNLINNNTSNFWKDIKRVKGAKNVLTNMVDNVTGSENIGNLFADKYNELYNCVSFNSDEMCRLIDQNSKDIVDICCKHKCNYSHVITHENVKQSIKLLKHNKSEGISQCNTNHLIYACDTLSVYLSLLFNSMLIHGVSPKMLLNATIIPIPKDKRKSLNDSNNYRAIALSSVISKVLDITILNSNREILDTCNLQFGFKKKHSTTQCTFVLNEVVQYYLNNDSDVYVMMLDCSKAFDRVHYVKLFSVLKYKGLCPLLVRLLIFMYIKQSLCVKWGSQYSNEFNVTNGVKQGGILSPVFFTVYIDELLIRLKKSGVGCYVGQSFLGGLGYADDGGLLAPTIYALKIMLKICETFGNEFNVLYNSSKYQLLHYSKNPSNIFDGLHHNGTFIPVENQACHLGHPIGPNCCDKVIEKGTNVFVVAFNGVNSCFNNTHIDVKYKLFKSFCMPLYGCVLWSFTSNQMSKFFAMWRKCIRKLLNLPTRCHSLYLPLIVNDYPVEIQLYKRFIKFIVSIISSCNESVKLCGKLLIEGSNSVCCRNLNYIAHFFNVNKSVMITNVNNMHPLIENKLQSLYCDSDFVNAGNIRDLLCLNDPNFNDSEIDDMIQSLCT